MDAIKFFKEKKRMCKSLGEGCTGCMIHITKCELRCWQFCEKYPERAVDIVETWAKEHPRKTILQDFLEKHPKATIEDGAVPAVCPFQLGYETESEKDKNGYCESTARDGCRRCWNRPLEEE